MTYAVDHLNDAELRALLSAALDELSPSRRRALVSRIRPPPSNVPPRAGDPTTEAYAVIDRTLCFLEDREEDLLPVWADDWNYDTGAEEDIWAIQAEMEHALSTLCGRLRSMSPTAGLRATVQEFLDTLKELYDWESDYYTGITYGELHDPPAEVDMVRAWLLATEPGLSPRDLAAQVVSLWPHPTSPNPLSDALGPLHDSLLSALTELADQGDAAAARWIITSADPAALERYKHLAPDLGRSWTEAAQAEGRWQEILDAHRGGVEVPGDALYRARLGLGRYEEAYADLFPLPHPLQPAGVWDEAVDTGHLDSLRSAARRSQGRTAFWIGHDEPELLVLPERYDHRHVKSVVSYAVARATLGEVSAEVGWSHLDPELRQRLATAPGPHDVDRCVEAALDGYERMIAFHVQAKQRSRYARAAAYWRAHGTLADRFRLEPRHAALSSHFTEQLRRLPAFRDEMKKAGNLK